MIEVVAYQDLAGATPFETWIVGLDQHAAAKVRATLLRMQQGNLGDVKAVGGGVSERRIDWGPGYRIYFGRDGGQLIVLLGGGTKGRQQGDIADAKSRWMDYKRRKGHLTQ